MEQEKKTYKKKKNKGTKNRTIAIELFKQWEKLQRNGDAPVIAEKLGVSTPTIQKALAYGCVHQQVIIDGINNFFADRLQSERDEAARLKSLTATQES